MNVKKNYVPGICHSTGNCSCGLNHVIPCNPSPFMVIHPAVQIGDYWDCVQVFGHSIDVNYDYDADEPAVTRGHPDRQTPGRAASYEVFKAKLNGIALTKEFIEEFLRETLEDKILELRKNPNRYED